MSFFPWLDSAAGGDPATRWTEFGKTIEAGQSSSGRPVYQAGFNQAHIARLATPDSSSVVVGFKARQLNSFSMDGSTVATVGLIQIMSDSGGTTHLTVTVTASGELRVRRANANGTVLATSATGVVSVGTWQDYELRATIADSGGRAEAWVDGAKVIDFTGDTKNGGTKTVVDTVRFGITSTGGSPLQHSDIVIDNTDGPKGPTMVGFSLPDGAGATTDLSQGAGSGANWQRVNEATPNGDTSYVFGDTEGQKDTYTVQDLPSGTWDVLAVQVTLNAKKSDSGTRFMRPVVRTGGADFAGQSFALGETYLTYRDSWVDNPDTAAAWTQAQVDAFQAGAEIRDS